MLAQILNAILGIWVMIAPSIWGFDKIVADNDHITGPIIATFAITAFFECTRPVRRFNILAGFWLLAAPWVLGYNATPAIINDMGVGALVIGFSFVPGNVKSSFGGGWASLWQESSQHEKEAAKRSVA